MYLKAVEVDGFKSFGEKIYIEFGTGITSIVGPNGSGKSNIMDAVLWVLGEQSYKNIRAKDSSDVIFSGNGKNASYAEVSLFIDNADRYLDMATDVVKITRRVTTKGGNDYYINDSKARLKDISGMFLDTGIGKSAYSVIGQGKVERIISSSSKEIKWIIEEAAGIKKYQIQKQESLKNLKNLDDELEKVSLVMEQIRGSRDHIEKQATKAKEFLDIKTEKELLEKGVLTFDFEKKTSNLSEAEEKKLKLEEETARVEKAIGDNEEAFTQNEAKRQELTQIIEDIMNKNSELRDSIEMSEREKARVTERLDSFGRELIEKEEQSEKIKEKIQEQKDAIEKLKNDYNDVLKQIESLEGKNNSYMTLIDGLEADKKKKELDQEILKRKLMEFEVEKLKVVNEIENSERRAKSAESKIGKLREEITEFDKKIVAINSELEAIQSKKVIQEKNVSDISERTTFLEETISKTSIEMNKLVEKVRGNEYEEKRASVRLQNLIKIEESNEGLFKGVKEVLNEKIDGVYGIVANHIVIPDGLEKAIEAAIPGNLQDIIVANADVAKRCIDLLKNRKAGRASFLALDTIKPSAAKRDWQKGDGVVGLGSDLVTSDPAYKKVVEFLLGNILIVDNIDKGLAILKSNEHNGNIVTLTGELLSSRGRVTGGEAQGSALSGMIERKQERKQLEILHESLTKELAVDNEKIAKIREQLENFENEIFEIDTKEEAAKKILKATNEELEEAKNKKERLERDLYIVKAEYDDEMKYISEFENKIQSSQSEKESTEDKIKNYKSDVETYSQEIVALQEKIRVQKEEYSDVRINYLNNVNKKEQLESEAQKLKFELTELEGSLDSNYARVEEVKVAITKGHDTISELEKSVAEQMKIYENENQDVNSKKLAVTKLSEEERELINERKNLESTLIKINDQNSKQIDYIDKLKFDIEKISEQLTTLIEIELKVIKEEEYETSRNRFKSLDNKLKNFETVNLLAIEEFIELNAKYQALKVQYDDMTGAKKTLLTLLDEISTEIETRFMHAYTAINTNFNEMCRDILANSEGELLFVEGETLDESGLDIVVKFKNKRRQSLSLFSGGEKSMVAIAFIMAIFMYKPSPFTFLDEIEAALDDRNTRKLIAKLKEFTGKSQFILITHNKETMRSSDTIFGVTMNKEIGLSKIVPVKF